MFNKIKTMQLEARKARNKVHTNLLTTLLGEFQRGAEKSDPTDDQVFKKLVALKEPIQLVQSTHPTADGAEELDVINGLLAFKPAAATAEQVTEFVTEVIAANPAAKIGDVMSALKGKFGNQLDGKVANQIARSLIN